MNAYYSYLNDLINLHKKTFRAYSGLKWINPYEVSGLQEQREKLLDPFKADALFKGTKPFYNHISKGCELCGKGLWSCLFIAGKCNAGCFYCPAPQGQDEPPQSQGIVFNSASAYAEYVNHFGFKGVAFSGGEPLLELDKVLAYTRELRKICEPDLYIWMYTNGILGTEEIFKQLAQAGINEVRFDIGAMGFRLNQIAKATPYIKNITIEIPAVPEEKERLKSLLLQMAEMGVTRLNLHQMRLTEHNVKKLATHNYTYIPAEQPVVLESELAAFEIMNFARENNLPIGINYCSFYFKNRFQKAGFRKIVANKLARDKEAITEKGFIRKVNAQGVEYDGLLLADKGRLTGQVQNLELKYKSYEYQQSTAKKIQTSANEIEEMLKKEPTQVPDAEDLFNIWMHEYIESGLRDY